MKYSLIIVLLIISGYSFSQSISEIDSVSKVICVELEKSRDVKNDALRYNNLYENQIRQYLATLDKKEVERVGQSLYYRLQRNCLEFMELLDRLDPAIKDEIQRVAVKPKSTISEKDLAKFKKTKDFFYYEVNGDITKVRMTKGVWTDSFKDLTTSSLTYKWTTNNEFSLIFVNSNNELRANFSVPGDEFLYTLISSEENYYVLTVIILGQVKYEQIKLYQK